MEYQKPSEKREDRDRELVDSVNFSSGKITSASMKQLEAEACSCTQFWINKNTHSEVCPTRLIPKIIEYMTSLERAEIRSQVMAYATEKNLTNELAELINDLL